MGTINKKQLEKRDNFNAFVKRIEDKKRSNQ